MLTENYLSSADRDKFAVTKYVAKNIRSGALIRQSIAPHNVLSVCGHRERRVLNRHMAQLYGQETGTFLVLQVLTDAGGVGQDGSPADAGRGYIERIHWQGIR